MNQKLIQNHDDAMDSHYFTYNKNEQNKKYPIKIEFFRISSKKFAQNQVKIKPNKTINLLEDETEENLTLSDDSIQNFVNYVHRQDAFLNNNNITGIHYLAKKYEVESLIKETEEYIQEHHQELILPLFLINQNDPSFDSSSYEKVISNNLEEYIDNETLSEINISILYRILSEYHSSKEMNNKVIDFIFKCADKHGRKASVLFSFIDINKIDSFHLNRLLTDYSKVIDFHFINSSLTLTLYEIQNQMIQQAKAKEKEQEEYKQNINKEIAELKKELIKMKEMNDKLINDQKTYQEQNANEIKAIKNDLNKMNQEHNKQMNEQKQREEQNLTKMNEKLANDQKIFKEQHANEIKAIKNDIDKMNQEHNKQMNEQKQREEQNLTKMNDKLINDQKILKEQHANEIKAIKNDIDKMNKIFMNQMNELKSTINQIKNENLQQKKQNESQLKTIQQLQQQMPNLTAKSLISQRNDNRIFPIPHLHAAEIESKNDTNQYFKNLLVWVCKNHKGVKFGTWIGAVAPNGRGWMTLTIYDTSEVNSLGLPRYCGGCYQACSTVLYTFCTYEFAFTSKFI